MKVWKNNKELKQMAQDVIMDAMAKSAYNINNTEGNNLTQDDKDKLIEETKKQMDRVAKLFGYNRSWFSC